MNAITSTTQPTIPAAALSIAANGAQTVPFTEIVKRTDEAFQILIECGYISPLDRAKAFEPLWGTAASLQIPAQTCQTWSTDTLGALIARIKKISESCQLGKEGQAQCLDKPQYALEDFEEVARAIQRIYLASIKKTIIDLEASARTYKPTARLDHFSFLFTLRPRIEILHPDLTSDKEEPLLKLERLVQKYSWIRRDAELKEMLIALCDRFIENAKPGTQLYGESVQVKAAKRLKLFVDRQKERESFELSFSDGSTYTLSYADACVLKQQSDYFDRMLFGPMKEGETGKATLDMTQAEFTLLLEAVLGKREQYGETELQSLIMLANRFTLANLFTQCLKWLKKWIFEGKRANSFDHNRAIGALASIQQVFDTLELDYQKKWEEFRDATLNEMIARKKNLDYSKNFLIPISRLQKTPTWPRSLKLDHGAKHIPTLACLPSITALHFTGFAGESLKLGSLANLPQLRELSVDHADKTIDKGEWQKLPPLERLQLDYCHEADFDSLPSKLPQVNELLITRSHSDEGVFPPAAYLQQLFSHPKPLRVSFPLPLPVRIDLFLTTAQVVIDRTKNSVEFKLRYSCSLSEKEKLLSALQNLFDTAIKPLLPSITCFTHDATFREP